MIRVVKVFFTGCLVLFSASLIAQVYHFDTREIPINWYGNRSDFTVNAVGELQLSAGAGTTTALLSWPIDRTENTSWEFLVRYDFAASATNYASFYLLSSAEDLGSSTNSAYYLKIGGASGATDKLELIFQSGSSKTTIIASQSGLAGGNTIAMRIRICQLQTGEWLLFGDETGGRNFVAIGKGTHISSAQFLFSGIRCLYTSTRRDKFYFDDIKTEEPFAIKKYEFNNEKQLTIIFTKPIKNPHETQLDIDLGQVYTKLFVENVLEIKTDNAIDPGQYTIRVLNAHSIHADTLISNLAVIKKDARYYAGQLRITEWMSDPSPTYGLPEIEWVEIINVSDTRIETAQLSLSDPTKKVKLPAYSLKKDSAVVLCSAGGCAQLDIHNCIEADALPNLNNTADSLFLWANDTILVDYIHYDITLLPNDYRRNGGYSIVRTRLPQACVYDQHLAYASEQQGGSPGIASGSITQVKLRATSEFISDTEARIFLNAIGSIQGQHISAYRTINAASLVMNYSTQIELLFEDAILPGNAITLTLDSIKTCLNHTDFLGAEIQLVHPKKIEKGTVFLNEILYNAYSGGVDFIELYNTSEEFIQLKNIYFMYADPKGRQQQAFLKKNLTIAPNDFVVLAADTTLLKRQYPNTRIENCAQVPGFISFADEGGTLIMKNEMPDTLDMITFNDDLQNPLNRSNEGISLEKIDAYKTYYSAANWTSSASGATPGYINSQNLSAPPEESQPFYCQPCHITTDLNGRNDYVLLYLNPSTTGTFASVSIYTLAGELVDKVCVNQLLGNQNIFQWNGQQQSNTLLTDGIYIAVAEWWLPNGKMRTAKIAISTSHY